MTATLRRDVSIAANANVDDQLVVDGHRDAARTASNNGWVKMYATASATGLRLGLFASTRTLGTNLEPFISSTGPLLDGQHFVDAFKVFAGEVIAMSVFNTTAGALTLRYHVAVP